GQRSKGTLGLSGNKHGAIADEARNEPCSLVAGVLDFHSQCNCVPRPREHFDRGHSDRLSVSVKQCPTRMDFQCIPGGLRLRPNSCRSFCGPCGTEAGIGCWRDLVGIVYGPDGGDSSGCRARTRGFHRAAIPPGGWRSCGLSRVQSVRITMDYKPGAGHGQWLDLRRSWCRRWPLAAAHYLHHAESRLALVILDVRAAWIGGGTGLAGYRARPPFATFRSLEGRALVH